MGFNYAIDLLGLVIALVILYSEKKNAVTGNADQKVFRILLVLIIAVFLFDIPGWLLIGKRFKYSRELSYLVNTLYYIAQIVYCYFWLLFADCWNRFRPVSFKNRVILYSVPAAIEIVVILLNPFNGLVFTVDADLQYSRGGLYYYNLIPYAIYILGAILITSVTYFKSRSDIPRKQSALLLSYMILPLAGTLLQMFNYGVSLLWPFTVISLVMIYLYVQQQKAVMNQLEQARTQQELLQANVSIMLSQIQPHFLYNSLAVVKCLCRTDPELAEKVVIDFSNYLRGNLDSISSVKPIRFIKELEHTKNFLKLEKLQYGNNLDIIYDICADSFMIPTLTLQPIAENAVKYGLKKKEHITIKISTYEDEDNYYLVVEDDGMGFDPNEPLDSSKSHIGITNVRNRLKAQTHSTLDIESVMGKGTKVIMTMPKEMNIK